MHPPHMNTVTNGYPSQPISTLYDLPSAFSTFLLVIRLSKEAEIGDYLLSLALHSLFAGSALLYSSLDVPSKYDEAGKFRADRNNDRYYAIVAPHIITAIQLLWITFHRVEGSFIFCFNLQKPPHSLISSHMVNTGDNQRMQAALQCTLAVPLILRPSAPVLVYYKAS